MKLRYRAGGLRTPDPLRGGGRDSLHMAGPPPPRKKNPGDATAPLYILLKTLRNLNWAYAILTMLTSFTFKFIKILYSPVSVNIFPIHPEPRSYVIFASFKIFITNFPSNVATSCRLISCVLCCYACSILIPSFAIPFPIRISWCVHSLTKHSTNTNRYSFLNQFIFEQPNYNWLQSARWTRHPKATHPSRRVQLASNVVKTSLWAAASSSLFGLVNRNQLTRHSVRSGRAHSRRCYHPLT